MAERVLAQNRVMVDTPLAELEDGWMSEKTKGALRVITQGEDRILVDPERPGAIVRRPGHADEVVAWPDLDVGARSPDVTVLNAPTGVWIVYRPMEAEDKDYPQGVCAAVHVSWAAALSRFSPLTSAHVCGTTRHGLWLRAEDADDASATSTAQIITSAGERLRVELPAGDEFGFAFDDGRRAWFLTGMGVGESGSHTHSAAYRRTDVSVLPQRVSRIAGEPFTEEDFATLRTLFESVWTDEGGSELPPWSLIDIPESDRARAVDSIRREFAHLVEHGLEFPGTQWERQPVTCEVLSDWPHTRVEIGFPHPADPSVRVIRSLPAFDAAGRALPALYASVHLWEDLGTGRLPAPKHAVDGILRF